MFQDYSVIDKIPLGDGTTKMFLNTKGRNTEGITESCIKLLNYLNNSRRSVDNADGRVDALDTIVSRIRRDKEKEDRYMDIEGLMAKRKEEGVEEAAIQFVLSMFSKGLSVELIADYLSLSINKVEDIVTTYAFNARDYLSEKAGAQFYMIPEASIADCKTKEDCDALLKRLGV